jgi:hypothetical protein
LLAEYDPATQSILLDGKTIALGRSDVPSFHALVDGSVVELIVADLDEPTDNAGVSRLMPELANQPQDRALAGTFTCQ